MKKLNIILLVALSSVALLVGCGKDKEADAPAETVNAGDIGLPGSTDKESDKETGKEEAETETPPQKGMVRSDLTNEWISEELAADRPIAVMFPINKEAQPQYGLSNIDIFYEILEEGKMSRQMGIINDWKDLDQIGNIRSIRDYFVYPALEWDSIIVHFGGPELYVSDILLRDDVENLNGTGTVKMGSDYGAFFRIKKSGVASEHTAYTSSDKLLKAIDKAGYSLTHRDEYYQPDHFIFANEKDKNTLEGAPGVKDATEIDMSNCFPVTKSALSYDKKDGLYYKTMYGKPQCDAETKEQLAFTNVIVQNTYFEQRDPKGYLYFQMHDDTRDGYYFTQGKCIPITWKKPDDKPVVSNYAPTKYYDNNGKEIVLNTGKTMIFIVEDGDKTVFE
ncbi:MAG: DUF3048 domain-containing protein [Lachnospiraceae bacterium]